MTPTTIQEAFSVQAGRNPNAVAVSAGGVRLTYRELDERSNRLAHRLVASGVLPETPVAVLMDRSPDLVVATLAVLKAGGFYLPLHTSHPLERMGWVMEHADRPVLLTDRAMRDRGLPPSREVILADQDLSGCSTSDPGVPGRPDRLAYLMYTSGSTGVPKGVGVTHRGVTALVSDRCWEAAGHDRVLMVAPHAFSVSTYELWVTLLRGGRLVTAPPGGLSVGTLRRLITEEEISCLHLTAGLFRVMAEESPACFRGVREVLTGGDVISPTAVQRVLAACPDTVVRAMYGATEMTLFAATATLTAPYDARSGVPIGRPMDGVRLYVLDELLEPVEDSAAGELYVAGDRLARGYFNRPDLTAERFVANPFGGAGERMYRTGDLVRRTPEGRLVFVGRVDGQTKIRGFRVEPGEVEAVLARFPGLSHVAVTTWTPVPGDTRLVAHIVPGPDFPGVASLRAHARESLPDYMTPAAFVVVDSLPLTPNGKLDRAALPLPEAAAPEDHAAPRDSLQETLCAIFADVLGVAQVGVDDDFFELGGQSLSATQLTGRINAAFGVDVPLDVLFDTPTVAELAAWLGSELHGSRLPARGPR